MCKFAKKEYVMKKATKIEDMINTFDIRPLDTPSNIDEFYVDVSEARGEDTAAKLELILNQSNRNYNKFLFGGHYGCGKSTELNRLAKKLDGEYFIIMYSIGEYADYVGVSFVDIVFSILKNISEAASKSNIEIESNILEDIRNYWESERVFSSTQEDDLNTSSEMSAGGSFLNILSAKLKLYLQSSSTVKDEVVRRVNPSITSLVGMVNNFLDDFQKKMVDKKLLLIIDDLDKVSLQKANEIFIDNSKNISSLHITAIYTFPIYLYYSADFRCIQGDFEAPFLLSMIKVKLKNGQDYEKGIKSLENIIYKRAEKQLFERDVVSFVIKKSGGCIRTVFRLLREAALKAEMVYMAQERITGNEIDDSRKRISMSDVAYAYRSYKSDMERVINKNCFELLSDIYRTKQPVIDGDNTMVMDLLKTQAVIEYNGERWCDLNPAVEDYLIDINVITNKDKGNDLSL